MEYPLRMLCVVLVVKTINTRYIFPNMFMDHYLQIEYDLHILNLAMSFDATYYKKCAKYELILLIAMSFDAFLKKYIILNEKE